MTSFNVPTSLTHIGVVWSMQYSDIVVAAVQSQLVPSALSEMLGEAGTQAV